MSNGHLGWANVRDDFDTVILVDDDGDTKNSLAKIDDAIASGVPLASKQVSYMSGEQETIDSIVAAFPEEDKAVRRYFSVLGKVRKATLGFVSLKFMPKWLGMLLVRTGLVYWMSDWFKYASISTGEMIKSITPNRTLQAVLAYNFGDYGTVPRDSPFSMHAVLQNHFLKGVSFPVGGSSEIAFNILPTILEITMITVILVTLYDWRFAVVTLGTIVVYTNEKRLYLVDLSSGRAQPVAVDELVAFRRALQSPALPAHRLDTEADVPPPESHSDFSALSETQYGKL